MTTFVEMILQALHTATVNLDGLLSAYDNKKDENGWEWAEGEAHLLEEEILNGAYAELARLKQVKGALELFFEQEERRQIDESEEQAAQDACDEQALAALSAIVGHDLETMSQGVELLKKTHGESTKGHAG